jgi:hypothetical protein
MNWHIHWWRYFEKHSIDFVFKCRECRCGQKHVFNHKLRKWHGDQGWNFELDWELEEYKKAVETEFV